MANPEFKHKDSESINKPMRTVSVGKKINNAKITGQLHSPQLIITNADGCNLVAVHDILFIQMEKKSTSNNKLASRLVFYLTGGITITTSNQTVSDFSVRLKSYLFLKINQSCIVNLQAVQWYKRKSGELCVTYLDTLVQKQAQKIFTISKAGKREFEEIFFSLSI